MTTRTIRTTPPGVRAQLRDDTKGTRTYTIAGHGDMSSVTSITSAGWAKPGLLYWAANTVADYALQTADHTTRRLDELRDLWRTDKPAAEQGRKDLYNDLRTAPDRQREVAADFGSILHGCVEHWLATGDMPTPPVNPEALAGWLTLVGIAEQDRIAAVERQARLDFLAWRARIESQQHQFTHFLETVAVEWEAMETTVYHADHRYAGTLDALAKVDGGPLALLDLKTGKGVYDDVALQLAAYRHATNAIYTDLHNHEPMPETDTQALVLHLRPEGWKLIAVDAGHEAINRFLATLHDVRWMNEAPPLRTVAKGKAK